MFEQYESDIKRVSTSKGALNVHKSINDLPDAFRDEVVKNNLTLKAAFFLYKNHYDHIPVCKVCGKNVVFDGEKISLLLLKRMPVKGQGVCKTEKNSDKSRKIWKEVICECRESKADIDESLWS